MDKIAPTDAEKRKFPVSTCNLSQLLDYSNLLVIFQTVRDANLQGQIPIILFDEFDTTLNGELGWLKFFLAPMQDGKFNDHGYTRSIGQTVFIFIGGTAHTYNEFWTDKIQFIPASSTTSDPTAAEKNDPNMDKELLRRWQDEEVKKAEKADKTR
jgi:hypothetical protein